MVTEFGTMSNELPVVNKSELLIGTELDQNIVDERGVLLLSSGSKITERVKSHLFKWGKVFFKNNNI